jgi:hypothetical protein
MKRTLSIFALILTLSAFSQQQEPVKIYRTTEVDAKPDLQAGMYTLTQFIGDNFKIPPVKNKKIRIFTSFIITPEGLMQDEKAFYISVKDYLPTAAIAIQTEEEKKAESALYEQMKAEAARVLALFEEKWTPATVGGRPVACLYNYPISFNIE